MTKSKELWEPWWAVQSEETGDEKKEEGKQAREGGGEWYHWTPTGCSKNSLHAGLAWASLQVYCWVFPQRLMSMVIPLCR